MQSKVKKLIVKSKHFAKYKYFSYSKVPNIISLKLFKKDHKTYSDSVINQLHILRKNKCPIQTRPAGLAAPQNKESLVTVFKAIFSVNR